jgi:hypothetical protein
MRLIIFKASKKHDFLSNFSNISNQAAFGLSQCCETDPLKVLSHENFRPVFLACMDAPMPEYEPLLILKLLSCSFDFWQLF